MPIRLQRKRMVAPKQRGRGRGREPLRSAQSAARERASATRAAPARASRPRGFAAHAQCRGREEGGRDGEEREGLQAPLYLSVFVLESLAVETPHILFSHTQKMEGGVPQLLARVRRLLRSKNWETRVAVSGGVPRPGRAFRTSSLCFEACSF